jgi:hypothetical protein
VLSSTGYYQPLMRAGVTAFALGAVMAVNEHHGDPPPDQYQRTNAVAGLAIERVSTSSMSSATTTFVGLGL